MRIEQSYSSKRPQLGVMQWDGSESSNDFPSTILSPSVYYRLSSLRRFLWYSLMKSTVEEEEDDLQSRHRSDMALMSAHDDDQPLVLIMDGDIQLLRGF